MRVLPPFLGTFGNALAITFSAPLVPSLLESLQVEADAGPQLQARGKKRKPDSAPVTAVLTAPNAVDFALQTASLCALSAVLTNGGSLLEPALRFQIDRVLLRLSLQVQLPPLPESRLALYTALQSSIASSFGCRSPLLPFALASFTSGSNDVDPGVSSFCRQALAVCESMQFAHGAVSVPLIGTSEAAAHEASPAQAQQTHDGPVAFPTFSSHPTSATTSSSSSSAASSSFGSSRAFGESGSLDLTALPPRNVKSRATASTSSSASTASSPLPPATSFDFSPAPTNTATPMDVTKDLENDEADEASGELVEIVGTGPDDVSDDSDE